MKIFTSRICYTNSSDLLYLRSKVNILKKLLIISEGKNTGIRLISQMNELLKDYLKIENILLSELKTSEIQADLILFTSIYVKNRGIRYVDPKITYIVSNRIIDHKNIKEIISIEEGKDVLFINDCYESASEAIEQLMELGLDHIKYHPYYPDCASYPYLETAITAGESQLAPYLPKKLIDIGARILDIQTIHEICRILDLERYLDDSLVTDYIRDIVEISKSIDESRKKSLEAQTILENIVNSLDYGVAFIDNEGEILSLNPKFEYILGVKRKDLIRQKIEMFLPFEYSSLNGNRSYTGKIENRDVSIQFREVKMYKKIGYILSIKQISKIEHGTGYMDNRILNRKLRSFKDYLTINKAALDMIERAKKFSKTDATILINGENGTGKEILAQGIHTNSFRNNGIFVPINMATISSNLLESELFGYEEGTFTGALKGGKTGIFEMAHGGTVFIDEIGDTPLDVQAKLLRVLEEKRIRRVGGVDEIPIDVRIIAATNKNLLELVEHGKFRLDLFFRLNILPLQTIPLRRRREDIEYLLKHFININLHHRKIETLEEFFKEETIGFLNNYEWIGNVRELINLVEYLTLIYNGERLGISSLHGYMMDVESKRERVYLSKDEVWILRQFEIYDNISLGRTRLAELAIDEGVKIGEGKIRGILKSLEKYGFIQSLGNMGSRITEDGRKFLGEL